LRAVVETFSKVDFLSLLPIFCIFMGVLLLGTLRLVCLVHYVANVHIAFLLALRASLAGLLSSFFIVNLVGSVAGRQIILRRSGVPVAATASIVTLERALMAMIGALLVAISATYLFGSGSVWMILNQVSFVPVLLSVIACLSLLLFLFRWERERALIRGLMTRRFAARFINVSAITLVGQAMTITAYFFAARAFGSEAGIVELLAAGSVISFAAGLPISVNGWGVREVSAVFALGQIGVPAPEALSISVLVGLVSSAAIFLMAPLLLVTQREEAATSSTATIAMEVPTTTQSPPLQKMGLSETAAARMFILIVGPAAALFVFYQVHVTLGGTLISVNLADPFVILDLALVAVLCFRNWRLCVTFPGPFIIWIGGIFGLFCLGFLIGFADFGVTGWALNNRLLGWLVLLGYLVTGGLLVSLWGHHGLRRLSETLVIAAAVITVFTLIRFEFNIPLGETETTVSNFEGFSKNRNSFAFQLLISLSAGIAYSKYVARSQVQWVYAILLGIIMFGIWRTYSNTGLITLGLLVGVVMLAGLCDRRLVFKSVLVAFGIYLLLAFVLPGIGFLVEQLTHWRVNPPGSVFGFQTATNVNERLMTLERGLDMWRNNPVFGAGLGAFANLNLGEHGGRLVIHSTPIWILAEFGLLGILVIGSLPLLYLVSVFRRGWQSLQAPELFLFNILLCFCLFGLPHDIFYQRIFWLVLGGCVAAYGLRQRRLKALGARPESAPRPVQP
jgi:hypothetical protein